LVVEPPPYEMAQITVEDMCDAVASQFDIVALLIVTVTPLEG
jgi:hypothetical protein